MVQTTFTFSYFLSLLITLITIYALHISAPNMMNFIKYFLIPITVACITLFLFNQLFPTINKTSDTITDYLEYKVITQLDNTIYYQLFPPLFICMIIFFIMLYLGAFN